MIRAALLSLTFVACAAAQTSANEGSSTAAMLEELARLEPEQGWTARPTSVAAEQWSYYRRAFGMAPQGNEPSSTRAGLGQLLFFDKRLSADRTRSCASCHDPLHGFAEPRPTSVGVGGRRVPRNAPTVMNAALQRRLFWDGRVQTLEEQAACQLALATKQQTHTAKLLLGRRGNGKKIRGKNGSGVFSKRARRRDPSRPPKEMVSF